MTRLCLTDHQWSLIEPLCLAKQGIELDPVDERGHTDRVVAVSRQQHEPHEVAQGIAKGEDFGRPTALGFAYACPELRRRGLILSPPFAPWP